MNIQLSEIAKALGTTVNCEKTIGRISIDSRDTDENTLFFAIKGERFDGHDFVKDVAEKGVGAVVCHKKTECSAPVIYVEDTKKACVYCGKQIDKNSRFCPKCGKELIPSTVDMNINARKD